MEQPKKERLLQLLVMLLGKRLYSISEIAKRLGTSERTVYRYMDTFNEAGFYVKISNNKVILLKESRVYNELSSLVYFTNEEVCLLYNVMDIVERDTLIKERLKQKLSSLFDFEPFKDKVINIRKSENLVSLIRAIEQQRSVCLHQYLSSHGQCVKDRFVEPFKFSEDYEQIWCYEKASSQNKQFKLSRIKSVEVLEEKWQYESLHLAGYVDIFRMSNDCGRKIPVSLEMNCRAYNLLLEEYPAARNNVRQLENGNWLLDTNVSNFLGIGRFIMGLSDDILIIKPSELREYIMNYAQKFIFEKYKK